MILFKFYEELATILRIVDTIRESSYIGRKVLKGSFTLVVTGQRLVNDDDIVISISVATIY